MQIPREHMAVRQSAELLAEILGGFDKAEDTRPIVHGDGDMWDAMVTIRGNPFLLEWKRSGSLGHVAAAIRQLEMYKRRIPHEAIPVLAVPYMGESARELCTRAEQSWLDLSGNARIIAPGIFYQNLGNPNRFRRAGRPESAFGPKGSRIARRLLIEPAKAIRQRSLASKTGLNEGHASRIVGKLVEAGLVERREDGITVTDLGALLDAWREEYRIDRHQIIRGHISFGGGDSLTRYIAESLSKIDAAYAATALPAAWLWTHHAGFRLATVFLSAPPSTGLKKDLGFREEPRGANTWFVVPNDEGVFDGAEVLDGICCVQPAQAYVDLKDHPERAAEAAAVLRRWFLSRDYA